MLAIVNPPRLALGEQTRGVAFTSSLRLLLYGGAFVTVAYVFLLSQVENFRKI
jgi:hypothetical protein